MEVGSSDVSGISSYARAKCESNFLTSPLGRLEIFPCMEVYLLLFLGFLALGRTDGCSELGFLSPGCSLCDELKVRLQTVVADSQSYVSTPEIVEKCKGCCLEDQVAAEVSL